MNGCVFTLFALFVAFAAAYTFFNGVEASLVAAGLVGPSRHRKASEPPPGLNDPHGVHAWAVSAGALSLTAAVIASAGAWYYGLGERPVRAVLATLLVTVPIVFVLCETFPRSLGRRNGAALLERHGWLVALVYAPFQPLVGALKRALPAALVSERRGVGLLLPLRHTPEELEAFLERSEQSGLVGAAGRKMLARILRAREVTVDRLMQPIERVVGAPESASVAVLSATVTQSGFTRIPIWRDQPNRIVGVVHATDLLTLEPGFDAEQPMPEQLQREPLRVPPSTTLIEMLRRFQVVRGHLATVEMEPGIALGLLTIEDVLEEMIGQIEDEHDPKEQGIRHLFQDTFLVDALLPIDSVNRRLGLELPAGDYDTLSGFLLWLFRKIPPLGSETSFKDIRFFVTKADGKRVEQAIVKKLRRG